MLLKVLVANIAAIITTACFLPQVISVLKAKDTKAVSLVSYIALFCGVSLWVLYGFLVEEYSIVISNIIIAICAMLVAGKKIINLKKGID